MQSVETRNQLSKKSIYSPQTQFIIPIGNQLLAFQETHSVPHRKAQFSQNSFCIICLMINSFNFFSPSNLTLPSWNLRAVYRIIHQTWSYEILLSASPNKAELLETKEDEKNRINSILHTRIYTTFLFCILNFNFRYFTF